MIRGVEDGQALEVAVRAARAGGRVALAQLGKLDDMRWKSHRDVVSGTTMMKLRRAPPPG
jgi:hypothetical protein